MDFLKGREKMEDTLLDHHPQSQDKTSAGRQSNTRSVSSSEGGDELAFSTRFLFLANMV